MGGGEGQGKHRVEPVRIRRNGDRAVAGVRVPGHRLVHHDDVLAAPERAEPEVIGLTGNGGHDLGPAAGADAEHVQPDADPVLALAGLRLSVVMAGQYPVGPGTLLQ